MFHLFIPDIGQPVDVNVRFSTEFVGNLKDEVTRLCGIPKDKQLLFAGPSRMSDNTPVAGYNNSKASYGVEKQNPITVLDLRNYDSKGVHGINKRQAYFEYQPRETLVEQGHNLNQLPAGLETLQKRVSYASDCLEVGKGYLVRCQEIEAHHLLQHQGLMAVIKSTDEKCRKVKKDIEKVQKRMATYNDNLPEVEKCMAEFEKAQCVMAKIPVPESMITATRTVSHSIMNPSQPPSARTSATNQFKGPASGDSMSLSLSPAAMPNMSRDSSPGMSDKRSHKTKEKTTPGQVYQAKDKNNSGNGGQLDQPLLMSGESAYGDAETRKTLAEWIKIVDKKDTVSQVKNKMDISFAKLKGVSVENMMQDFNSIATLVGGSLRKIEDMDTRMMKIKQACQEMQKLIEHQDNSHKSLKKNLENAGTQKNSSEYVHTMHDYHQKFIKQIIENHEKITDFYGQLRESKKELSHAVGDRIQHFLKFGEQLEKLDCEASLIKGCLDRVNRLGTLLGQINQTPELFVKSVVEAYRRKRFAKGYAAWTEVVCGDGAFVYEKEMTRRKEFDKALSGNFISSMLTGLKDTIPKFAVHPPEAFDQALPDITQEDIDLIVQYVPHLAHLVKLDDYSDIPEHLQSTLKSQGPEEEDSPVPASLMGGKEFVPVGKTGNKMTNSMASSGSEGGQEMFHSLTTDNGSEMGDQMPDIEEFGNNPETLRTQLMARTSQLHRLRGHVGHLMNAIQQIARSQREFALAEQCQTVRDLIDRAEESKKNKLAEQIAILTKKLDESRVAHEKKLENAEGMVRDLKEKLKDSDQDTQSRLGDLDTKMKQFSDMEKQLKELERQKEEDDAERQEMTEQYQTEIAGMEIKLVTELAQKVAMETALKEESEKHKQEVKELQEMLEDHYQKEFSDLKRKYSELDQDKEQDLRDLQTLINNMSQNTKKTQELHAEELQKLQSDLDLRWERRLEGVRAEFMEEKKDALLAQRCAEEEEFERRMIERAAELREEYAVRIETDNRIIDELKAKVDALQMEMSLIVTQQDDVKEEYATEYSKKEAELEASYKEKFEKKEEEYKETVRALKHEKEQAIASLRTEHELVLDGRERDLGRSLEKYRRETEQKADQRVAEVKAKFDADLQAVEEKYKEDLEVIKSDYLKHFSEEFEKTVASHKEEVAQQHQQDLDEMTAKKDTEREEALKELEQRKEQEMEDMKEKMDTTWHETMDALRTEMEEARESDKKANEEDVRQQLDDLETHVRAELQSALAKQQTDFEVEKKGLLAEKELEMFKKSAELETEWQEHFKCQEREHLDTQRELADQHKRDLQKYLTEQKEKLEKERDKSVADMKDSLTFEYHRKVREVQQQLETKDAELNKVEDNLLKMTTERDMIEERYGQLLKGKHEEMEKALEEHQAEKQELQEKLNSRQTEFEKLKDESTGDRETLEERLFFAQSNLNKVRMETSEEMSNLKQQMDELQVKLDEKTREMNEAQAELRAKLAEREKQLEQNKHETTEKIMCFEKALEAKEALLEQTKVLNKEASKEMEGHVTQIKAQMAQREKEMINAMDELRAKLEEQVEEAMDQLQKVEANREEVKCELEELLGNTRHRLQEAMSETENYKYLLEEEKASKNEDLNLIRLLKEEMDSVKARLAATDTSYLDELNHHVTSLRTELEQSRHETTTVREQAEAELLKVIQDYQANVRDLEARLDDSNKSLVKAKLDMGDLSSRMDDVVVGAAEERSRLMEELSTAQEEMKAQQEEASKIQMRMAEELEVREKHLNKARAEALQVRAQLEERLTTVQQQLLDKTRSESTQLLGATSSSAKDDVVDQLSSLKKKLELTQAESATAQQQMELELEQAKRDLEYAKDQAEKTQFDLEQKVTTLQQQVDRLYTKTSKGANLEDELKEAQRREKEAQQTISELQSQLSAVRSVSPSPTTTCSENIDRMSSSAMVQSVVLAQESSEHMQKLETELKDREETIHQLQSKLDQLHLSPSTRNIVNDKISVYGCNKGDVVLVHYSDVYKNFIVFQLVPVLHFLHADCLESLGLKTGDNLKTTLMLGEVTSREYCQARKSPNRFHVSKGTKFYRVRLVPWGRPPPSVSTDTQIIPFIESADRLQQANSQEAEASAPPESAELD